MQTTTHNLPKVPETRPPNSHASSNSTWQRQSPSDSSQSSSDHNQLQIPSSNSKGDTRNSNSSLEEDEDEVIIPVTAVRKHLDHSQPRISSIRRTSTSVHGDFAKSQSMDVVRQRDNQIEDHYRIQSTAPQNPTPPPAPRKRRMSGASAKSIQSNHSNVSFFGSGGSMNRLPNMMKTSLGSMKQFVSRSTSLSTASRSRFSLRPSDKSNSRGTSNTSGSSLESVQENSPYSPQPTFNSVSTPTSRNSRMSQLRRRTSSIIDLTTMFAKQGTKSSATTNEEGSLEQSNSSSNNTPHDEQARPAPKLMANHQQQNDTQKAQDPRQVHNNYGEISKQIDEYRLDGTNPGGVGTMLFGKEIDNIDIEDITSGVQSNFQVDKVETAIDSTCKDLQNVSISAKPVDDQLLLTTPSSPEKQNGRDRRSRGSYNEFGSILITTTLTTLHSKVHSECDRLLASVINQGGSILVQEFQAIMDDLKKMANMIEAGESKMYLNARLESLIQRLHSSKTSPKSTGKHQEDVSQINTMEVKPFVTDIKHFSNECLSRHYQYNEKAMVIPAKGYWIEGNNRYTDASKVSDQSLSNTVDYKSWEREHYDHDATWFRHHFAGQNYLSVCGTPNDQCILITIKEENVEAATGSHDQDDPQVQVQYRVVSRRTNVSLCTLKFDTQSDVSVSFNALMDIVQTPDVRCIIPGKDVKKPSSAGSASALRFDDDLSTMWPSVVRALDDSLDPHELKVISSEKITAHELEQSLIGLDELGIHTRYKFGVLLVKQNQTKEEEWFANSHAPDCLERFLDVIGHRVELQGYQGWAAGLDTRSGDSGMFTYTDTWRDAVITYHVSTLIPSKSVDKQHIQRKRHIGNDIVCIIFVDGRQPFNPAAIKSQFLHVFIVVHEERLKDQYMWRVEIVANENVSKFGPPLPTGGIFYDKDQLRDFIHAKLINAENSALKSPKFAQPNARAREGILQSHIQRATGALDKPIGTRTRRVKSASTLSDPSRGSNDVQELPGQLEFNLPARAALSRSRSTVLSESGRRRSAQENGVVKGKPWISRNKKGKGYGHGQGHRRSRSEVSLPVSVSNTTENESSMMDAHASGQQWERDGIRSRAHFLFTSLQQWGGRFSASPDRTNPDAQP
ncbi:hypothetical protein INT43_001720, partial [Umbelopsis isabellina]